MAQAPTPNGATIFAGISSDPANVLNQFLDSDGHFKWTLATTTVVLDVSPTGEFRIHDLKYPAVDGTAGYVLTTDGAGTLSFSAGTPGPPGPPGGVNGTGANTQITVWNGATTITGYTDFLWDDANKNLLAADSSTIDASTQQSAIIASTGSSIGPNAFISSFLGGCSSCDIGLTGSATFYTAILGSDSALIDSGASYSGMLGTSQSKIYDGAYNAVVGSSLGVLGGNLGGASTPTPNFSTSYSALAGVSSSYIDGGTYDFIGGCSQCAIDGTTFPGADYSAIIGASQAINRGTYSAIAGSSGGLINAGCSGCAILGGDGVTATIGASATNAVIISGGEVDTGLNQAVAINGGHATVSDMVAIGGQTLDQGISSTITGSYFATAIIGSSSATLVNASYSAIAGGSQNQILDTTFSVGYSFMGGGSQNIIDSASYSVVLGGSTNVIDSTNGDYSAILGGTGGSITGSGNGTIINGGNGAVSTITHDSVVLVGQGMSSVANDSVSLGVSAVPEVTITNVLGVAPKVALGGGTQFTLGSVVFTGLGAFNNGTMLYCTDCDPTATLLACTHVGTQTGAFAYRVNGAWKCMG